MVIYVGIPMYGGAHGLAVRSLLSLQSHLLSVGHKVIFDIVANGSILTKSRNGIVKRFMDSPAETLLFIDSDMVYEPQDVAKIIHAPFDVSVISYRSKQATVNFLAHAEREDGEVVGTKYLNDYYLKTTRAGTGLMAIKRRTIEYLQGKHPDLVYEDQGIKYSALFDFVLENGQYHGEDYTFCKRVDEAGGQIFILADAYAGHIGDTIYDGNYHEYLVGAKSKKGEL